MSARSLSWWVFPGKFGRIGQGESIHSSFPYPSYSSSVLSVLVRFFVLYNRSGSSQTLATMSTPSSPASDPRETIREEWSAAAQYWKKWHGKLVEQSRRATELVVEGANLSPGLHVLDLACGTGEPSLTIAEAVGQRGRVVATDLVPQMLNVAEQNATARGLRNMEFQVADAEQLPFPKRHFDRVTSRFGIMFFPDIQRALAEMRRVLKPGGSVSFVTWGPREENPVFSTMIRPFVNYVQIPQPGPDSPHVFRYSEESKLAHTLAEAGFGEIQVTKHKIAWPWPGSAEDSWLATSEIAAPFKKMIAAVPAEKREEAIAEVIEGIRVFSDGRSINFPASVISTIAIAPW
jgi:ubiquinone/menaquinone biosynthesis C-methylase UbiE